MTLNQAYMTNTIKGIVIDWIETKRVDELRQQVIPLFKKLLAEEKISQGAIMKIFDENQFPPNWIIYKPADNGVERMYIFNDKTPRNIDRILEKNDILNVKFSDFIVKDKWQDEMKKVAIDYCDNATGFLMITAPTGTGKTMLGSAILRIHSRDYAKNCKRMKWSDFAGSIKSDYLNRTAHMKDYLEADLLLIDDLLASDRIHKGNLSPAVEDATLQIIQKRYERNLPTIITSTKTIKQIVDINEQIGSIVYQMSRKYNVEILKSQAENQRMKGN